MKPYKLIHYDIKFFMTTQIAIHLHDIIKHPIATITYSSKVPKLTSVQNHF